MERCKGRLKRNYSRGKGYESSGKAFGSSGKRLLTWKDIWVIWKEITHVERHLGRLERDYSHGKAFGLSGKILLTWKDIWVVWKEITHVERHMGRLKRDYSHGRHLGRLERDHSCGKAHGSSGKRLLTWKGIWVIWKEILCVACFGNELGHRVHCVTLLNSTEFANVLVATGWCSVCLQIQMKECQLFKLVNIAHSSSDPLVVGRRVNIKHFVSYKLSFFLLDCSQLYTLAEGSVAHTSEKFPSYLRLLYAIDTPQ